MRIFLTGGSGFVGSAVIKAWHGRHELLAMARSAKSAEAVRALGATPVLCSLDDVTAAQLSGCDAVVHAAAHVVQWGQLADFEKANVEGTQRMLTAARKAGVKRFVHVGTEAALFYGQHLRNVDESYPLALSSPFYYSRTKAMAEQAVRSANDSAHGFETIVIRPRMIWGPGDQTILPVIKEMVEKGMYTWIAQGQFQTSTTHVQNLVHGLELALTRGEPGSAYFVLDDAPLLLRDFISRYLATCNVQLPAKSIPSWLARGLALTLETVYRGLGIKSPPPLSRLAACMMSVDCVLNDSRARRELGYCEQITVDQGMRELQQTGAGPAPTT